MPNWSRPPSPGEGEISDVLESPIGLHILRCDEILPSGMLPFAEVAERIITGSSA
jgi:peptidyl-prolyl cis-trans isomerase C